MHIVIATCVWPWSQYNQSAGEHPLKVKGSTHCERKSHPGRTPSMRNSCLTVICSTLQQRPVSRGTCSCSGRSPGTAAQSPQPGCARRMSQFPQAVSSPHACNAAWRNVWRNRAEGRQTPPPPAVQTVLANMEWLMSKA